MRPITLQWLTLVLCCDEPGAEGVEFCTHDRGVARSLAESQMSLPAQLPGRYWDSSELHETKLPNFADRAGFADYQCDLEACCTRGFEMAREVIPAALYQRGAEVHRPCRDRDRRPPRAGQLRQRMINLSS